MRFAALMQGRSGLTAIDPTWCQDNPITCGAIDDTLTKSPGLRFVNGMWRHVYDSIPPLPPPPPNPPPRTLFYGPAPPPPPLTPPIYKSPGYYEPAKGCDVALNAYCQKSCSPLISGVETIARFGAGPRWIDLHAWRCYSLSVLTDDTLHYKGGTLLCSRHTEIVNLLQQCQQWSPPPPLLSPPQPPPQPPPQSPLPSPLRPPMASPLQPPMAPPLLPPRRPPLEPAPPPPSNPMPPPLLPQLPVLHELNLSAAHQPGMTPRDVGLGWALILAPLFVTTSIVAYHRLGLCDRLKVWWQKRRRRLPESEVEIIVAEASKHMAVM